ncbi:S24 family peptidase [Marinomonas transparens]|uniref:UV protection and mutation protein n=1 Tax=Marinomonas transparens TaxID=2795388 RepID=A0A934JVF4_9GAMM|nr:S24 family peptidase [Marinomonas transparens]MBJ7539091.1 UV protection and mutation protein [Marinomonas transparens]
MRVSYLGSSESAAFIAANSVRIPLYSQSAALSSADESLAEESMDLNELCIQDPAATFFVRAQGESETKIDINSGDVLVVDRSLTARHGDVVIACEFGELTVKTLELQADVLLRPKNKAYAARKVVPLAPAEAPKLEVFGVVTSVVRQLERG